ncbi:pyridoxamine 5'-phosphate oxidase family protein [Gimesia algae]|uniref:Pyridoxamine 5'-phosphate oxidase n=1 Tax=Gimesia algae TaxID=2527971 RepID=A0A517VHT7_9PLAN|nr:pyridoxamine 5'-phosphate oxidase family protein [Gimesia algae]QDT92579.1 Pyridoxamine 5'-phosphate oxidase [Gimesia algae]
MDQNVSDSGERQKSIETLREMIRDIHIAMLTTRSEDGGLRSRPMITAKHEFEGQLWFFTHADDPKVGEIIKQNAVNLAYADPERDCYISITGQAELVRDQQKIELLWTDELEQWFPQGFADPKLALICVNVSEAEYWDANQNQLRGILQELFFETEQEVKHDRLKWSDATS